LKPEGDRTPNRKISANIAGGIRSGLKLRAARRLSIAVLKLIEGWISIGMGYRLLVIGYWLLVIGYWLLVIGYWLLVIGN